MQVTKAQTIEAGAVVECVHRSGKSERGIVSDTTHQTAPVNKTPAQILYVWMSVKVNGVVSLWPSNRVMAL